MHHVLIRDDELGQYRRIVPEDRERLVVCPDGDLYRVVNDPSPAICLVVDGERLCDFPVPHRHPVTPVYQGSDEERLHRETMIGLVR